MLGALDAPAKLFGEQRFGRARRADDEVMMGLQKNRSISL
jgi:hypothetical protein